MSGEDQQQIKQTVRKFITDSVRIARFRDDENLFESGIVNSLFAVELMLFLEKTFSIEVATDDLEMTNFGSLNAIAMFVARRSENAELRPSNYAVC